MQKFARKHRLMLGLAGLLAVGAGAGFARLRDNLPERPPGVPPVAAGTAASQLRTGLEGALRVPGWSNDHWSVLVMSLDYGDTLFAHGADQPLAPASNMKLFTSSAALYYLGPNFRWGTYLATPGRIRNGVLEGDLVVYGTGDPTLSDKYIRDEVDIWQAFADTLAALGVREVRGDVVGDASYFGGVSTGTGWDPSYINAWYAAPASALTYNDNIVTLRIRPAEQVGWRPQVELAPGGEGIALVNRAETVASGRRTLEVTRAAYDGPIVIRGQLPRSSGVIWRAVPVADPARFAAAVFRETLEKRGIAVTGSVRSVHRAESSLFTGHKVFAPALASERSPRVLAIHRSPPLQDALTILNKHSHNLYAEQIVRTVGRVVYGTGSVEAGHSAIEAMLKRETGRTAPVLRMDDGSGLSPLNRTSAQSIVQLLTMMYHSPHYAQLDTTLPVAGRQGLRRMGRSSAQDNLHAKTGTIDNVSALSGWVTAADGEKLVFSIISNEVPSTWKAKRIEDQIGSRLASFSRPAPASAPIPRLGATTAAAAPAPAPAGSTTAAPAGDTTGANAAAPSPANPPQPPAQQPGAQPVPQAASAPAPGTAAEPQAPATHVIRKGDTLEGIAKRYGTTVDALKHANPGVSPRRLIPGRTLKLP